MSGPASKLVAALGAASAALTLTACGGGSSALSAADLRTQADAICAKTDAATKAIGQPSTAGEIKTAFPKILDAGKTQLTELKALKAPDELKTTWNEAIAALDKQYNLVAGAGAKIAAGEDAQTAIASISTETDAVTADLKAKAAALGLKQCGNDSSSSSSGTDTTSTESTTDTSTDPSTSTDGSTTTDETTSTDSGAASGSATAATFASDATGFGTALQSWGTLVTTINSGSDITKNLDTLRGDTDKAEVVVAPPAGDVRLGVASGNRCSAACELRANVETVLTRVSHAA